MATSSPSSKPTNNPTNDVGFIPETNPTFSSPEDHRTYIKGRLAGAFRIFSHHHLNEGAAGHITVRDPIDPQTFWVNPFGLDFHLITASDLIRVDHQGNILDHGRVKALNRAAFCIHAAIHKLRPDVMCAAHTHSIHGRAFCALGRELDMLGLEACAFYKDHVSCHGQGVVLAEEEGVVVAEALGDKKAALLRNHGLLTVGRSIEEAVNWFYMLDRVCHVQLLADAAVKGRGEETYKVCDEEARHTMETVGSHRAGWFGGQMMFELIDQVTGKSYLK